MAEFLSCITPSVVLILAGAALIAFVAIVIAALYIFFTAGAGAITIAALMAILGPFVVPFLVAVLGSLLLALMFCINGDVAAATPAATSVQGLTSIGLLAGGYGAIAFGFRQKKA